MQACEDIPAHNKYTAELSILSMNSLQPVCMMSVGCLQGAATVFDRQRWAAQLRPLMTTWDQLVAAAPPSIQQQAKQLPAAAAVTGSRGSSAGSRGTDNASPVDTFVELERAHAGVILGVIQATMSALSKAFSGVDPLTHTMQVNVCIDSCFGRLCWDEATLSILIASLIMNS